MRKHLDICPNGASLKGQFIDDILVFIRSWWSKSSVRRSKWNFSFRCCLWLVYLKNSPLQIDISNPASISLKSMFSLMLLVELGDNLSMIGYQIRSITSRLSFDHLLIVQTVLVFRFTKKTEHSTSINKSHFSDSALERLRMLLKTIPFCWE